jgi:hypothetical protein
MVIYYAKKGVLSRKRSIYNASGPDTSIFVGSAPGDAYENPDPGCGKYPPL